MRSFVSIVLAASALLVPARSAICQRLVGVSFNGTLVTVDPATGVGTPLGSLGFSGAGGLARIGDVVYTNTNGGGLWKIDPWTGASSAGPTTAPVLNSIRAMATNRVGVLYVIQNGGGQTGTTTPDLLYTVDPRNGAATLVGSTSTFVGIQGLAFSRSGVLYGWDTNAGLVTIAPATAVTTDVNPGVGAAADIQALTCSPNGTLYGARHALYTIDPATGVPTLVGSGGYSDLRGVEYVHGPRIYDNGPVVTHPGGGFGGGDLSMVQSNLGLQYSGWIVDPQASVDLTDEFQTNGTWTVDGFEFFFFHPGGPVPTLSDVRLSIWNGIPGQGTLVAGSPPPQVNLLTVPTFDVALTLTDIYRAAIATPLANSQRLQRIRILPATPFVLDSAASPTGRFWLRVSFGFGTSTIGVPAVTTLGLAAPGNVFQMSGPTLIPIADGGAGVAIPFGLFGTSQSSPAAITSLGGGCGAGGPLNVRGATCAGGAVVHEFPNTGVFPGLVLGIGDPNLAFAPACGCVLHANLDFVSLGQSRYDLVAPPGIGTGFEYRVQGLQLDFLGTAGLPCDFGLGFDFRLTDAYRVRFW